MEPNSKTNEEKSPLRRTTLIKESSFQTRYVIYSVIFAFFVFTTLTALFTWMISEHYNYLGHLSVDLRQEIAAQRDLFLMGMGLVEVIFLILIVSFATLLTFHIAGPAFSIKRSLQRLAQGDLSFHLKLRKNDHLKEIAEELNNVIEVEKSRRLKQQALLHEALTRLRIANQETPKKELEEAIYALDNLDSEFSLMVSESLDEVNDTATNSET
jgi:methyl-accepting chemotaxis protein